ncbi:hypothetical protein P7F88_21355 [Vibrio hannami]|uniref:DUF6602 domain-containing protein n=1 Tax=Vibrio hannami TaxID=2717094 RepID=UPI002410001C|nr:DUF6602 domain-containing protein [Vibrio hannami]MDG3088470.1 hypothetical protein [Vibrio hannami]
MAHHIFEKLMDKKISDFVHSMKELANECFYDPENDSLIHPGEYGVFKEQICAGLLSLFIPENYGFGSGFIITPNGSTSTQCDLVIYDKSKMLNIKASNEHRFFPVDPVLGVVEVKSTLSKTDFKKAINKLSNIKKLREECDGMTTFGSNADFNPELNFKDQIFSVLICNKLNFNLENISNEISDLYDSDVNLNHRHNLILSIEDGIIYYHMRKNIADEFKTIPQSWSYPTLCGFGLKNRFDPSYEESNYHFKTFLTYFSQAMHEHNSFMTYLPSYFVDESVERGKIED